MTQLDWDAYFLKMTEVVASKSKDRSSKVGCVIVGPEKEIRSTGYNGFIRGANDNREDWHLRPLKYSVTIHAEANAVANAARSGISLNGCTAYISLPPCSNCALLLAQSGIVEIRIISPPWREYKGYNSRIEPWETQDKWKKEFEISEEIFKEGNISVVYLNHEK